MGLAYGLQRRQTPAPTPRKSRTIGARRNRLLFRLRGASGYQGPYYRQYIPPRRVGRILMTPRRNAIACRVGSPLMMRRAVQLAMARYCGPLAGRRYVQSAGWLSIFFSRPSVIDTLMALVSRLPARVAARSKTSPPGSPSRRRSVTAWRPCGPRARCLAGLRVIRARQ